MRKSNPEAVISTAFRWYAAMVFMLLMAPIINIAHAADPLQQSYEMHVPEAPTPITVQGKVRLVYELHLVNFASESLVLQQLVVRDGKASIVGSSEGEDLASRLYLPGNSGSESRAIAPGMHAVIFLELTPGRKTVPKILAHEIVFSAEGEELAKPVTVRGGRIAVKSDSPIVLSPPLSGGPWAAIYELSWKRGHRRSIYAVNGRAYIPGRFAIDWVKLDDEGRSARGDTDKILVVSKLF